MKHTATRSPDWGSKSGSLAPSHTGTPTSPRQPYPTDAYVLVAQNGEHSILKDGTPPPPTSTPPRRGGRGWGRGWVRGRVKGKTRRSRNRFLRFVASLDQKVNPAARCVVLTISYGRSWPPSPGEWSRDLKRFRQKLERRFGPVGVILTKEFQGRGAPHFHLVAALPDGVFVRQFTRAPRRAWRSVTKDDSSTHLRRGAHGQPLQSWRRVRAYLAKSEALPIEPTTGKPTPTGRWWSVWRAEKLTRTYRKIKVPSWAYPTLRSIFRVIAGQPVFDRPGVPADESGTTHVLLPYNDMLKLLELLGVDPP